MVKAGHNVNMLMRNWDSVLVAAKQTTSKQNSVPGGRAAAESIPSIVRVYFRSVLISMR